MELAALERVKNRCLHFFAVAVELILFKLTSNKDKHKILEKFEFWPVSIIYYGVSCP